MELSFLLLVLLFLSPGSQGDVIRCYDCNYDPGHYNPDDINAIKQGIKSDRGFPRCALEEVEDSQFVDHWPCTSGTCFLRRDPNGLVYRGCADRWNLPWGIDTSVSCRHHRQDRSLYWFCEGNLCNGGKFGEDGICSDVADDKESNKITGDGSHEEVEEEQPYEDSNNLFRYNDLAYTYESNYVGPDDDGYDPSLYIDGDYDDGNGIGDFKAGPEPKTGPENVHYSEPDIFELPPAPDTNFNYGGPPVETFYTEDPPLYPPEPYPGPPVLLNQEFNEHYQSLIPQPGNNEHRAGFDPPTHSSNIDKKGYDHSKAKTWQPKKSASQEESHKSWNGDEVVFGYDAKSTSSKSSGYSYTDHSKSVNFDTKYADTWEKSLNQDQEKSSYSPPSKKSSYQPPPKSNYDEYFASDKSVNIPIRSHVDNTPAKSQPPPKSIYEPVPYKSHSKSEKSVPSKTYEPPQKSVKSVPPAKSVKSLPPIKSVKSLPPVKSVKSLPPVKSVKSLPPIKSVKSLPPVKSVKSLPPMKSIKSIPPPSKSVKSAPVKSSSPPQKSVDLAPPKSSYDTLPAKSNSPPDYIPLSRKSDPLPPISGVEVNHIKSIPDLIVPPPPHYKSPELLPHYKGPALPLYPPVPFDIPAIKSHENPDYYGQNAENQFYQVDGWEFPDQGYNQQDLDDPQNSYGPEIELISDQIHGTSEQKPNDVHGEQPKPDTKDNSFGDYWYKNIFRGDKEYQEEQEDVDPEIPVLATNPCEADCHKNPSGLFPHPYKDDWFIQCSPGLDSLGSTCNCCKPNYLRCPAGTIFDVLTRVCGTLSEAGYHGVEYQQVY